MTTSPAARVAAYLDDVARMLQAADPAERAEVLGGLREHIDAALADGPQPPGHAEVDGVLLELGPPEEVAAAALEDPAGRGGGRVSLPVPAVVSPAVPSLGRTWVPPTVGLLTALVAALYLLIVVALAVRLAAQPPMPATDVATGGFAGPSEADFSPLLPAAYDLLWTVLVPLPITVWPWLAATVLLAASPLWTLGEKWLGALLAPCLTLLGLVLGVAEMASLPALRVSIAVPTAAIALAGTVWTVARLWRVGAARARVLADHEADRAARAPGPLGPMAGPSAPMAGRSGPGRTWVLALAVGLGVLGGILALPALVLLPVPTGSLVPGAWTAAMVVLLVAAVGVALVVSLSPRWSRSEKVAAWSVPVGIGLLTVLAAHLAGLVGTCEASARCPRGESGAATLVWSFTALLAVAGAAAVAGRLAGTGARSARDGVPAPTASATVGPGWAERWWVPPAAAVGLASVVLAAAVVPVILARYSYWGSADGVWGFHLAPQSWDRAASAVEPLVPVWLSVVVLLARSPLWGRGAPAVAAGLPVVMVAAGVFLATGRALTPPQVALLPAVSAVLALSGAVVTAIIWSLGVQAARRREGRTAPGPAARPGALSR